jgi:hypothetical protein
MQRSFHDRADRIFMREGDGTAGGGYGITRLDNLNIIEPELRISGDFPHTVAGSDQDGGDEAPRPGLERSAQSTRFARIDDSHAQRLSAPRLID